MTEITTLAYSDSSLYRPRKVDEPVPIAGYLILPSVPTNQIPLLGTLAFEDRGDAQLPRWGSIPAVVANYGDLRMVPQMSTASVAYAMPTDFAFLADEASNLPASIEDIATSRAGRGLAVWDLLAQYSALRYLKRTGVKSGDILFRTDGDLPDWVSGAKKVTVEVGGKNIAPALVELIHEVESDLPPVRRETVSGWNIAEGPIRQVIDRGRREARRADLEIAHELRSGIHRVG